MKKSKQALTRSQAQPENQTIQNLLGAGQKAVCLI